MRSPSPKTFSAAVAKAEAAAVGASVDLSVVEARALIYETSASCGLVHFPSISKSHATPASDVWDVAGYSDVQRIIGAWCARPAGRVFAISVTRPNGGWHIDIITPALPARN